MIEQIGKAAGARVVVAAVLVGEQQAGVFRPGARRREPIFGIEQNGAGVRRENARDRGLELLEHGGGDVLFVDALFLGDGALERAALVHGGRGDHAALIGYRLHALLLSRRNDHVVPPRYYVQRHINTRKRSMFRVEKQPRVSHRNLARLKHRKAAKQPAVRHRRPGTAVPCPYGRTAATTGYGPLASMIAARQSAWRHRSRKNYGRRIW